MKIARTQLQGWGATFIYRVRKWTLLPSPTNLISWWCSRCLREHKGQQLKETRPGAESAFPVTWVLYYFCDFPSPKNLAFFPLIPNLCTCHHRVLGLLHEFYHRLQFSPLHSELSYSGTPSLVEAAEILTHVWNNRASLDSNLRHRLTWWK